MNIVNEINENKGLNLKLEDDERVVPCNLYWQFDEDEPILVGECNGDFVLTIKSGNDEERQIIEFQSNGKKFKIYLKPQSSLK